MIRSTVLALLAVSAAAASDPLLFVYFKEPANMGVFFATSTDGYHWTPANKGRPWYPVEQPGELMRDPFIARGPDHEFHMVWTWGWRGQSIGYAHSPDLVHWSEQREIPLMAGTPGAANTWAPEIYWDAGKSKWLIVWSSTVEGRHEGNRIYSTLTADFKTFSHPEIFFDPGYMVIDATILQTAGKYYLVFKDERLEPLHKQVKIAEGDTLEGPWRNISEALTEPWSEGPSAVDLGGEYIIYYDHYRDPRRYEAIRSTDLRHWTPVTDRMTLPENAKHGGFLKLTAAELKRIQGAPGSPWAAVSQSLPDLAHEDQFGDPPYLAESGWKPLLNGRDLSGWRAEGGEAQGWFTSPAVEWRRVFSPTGLTADPGPGGRIVNGREGKAADLLTDARFGSFELYLEFLLAKGSIRGRLPSRPVRGPDFRQLRFRWSSRGGRLRRHRRAAGRWGRLAAGAQRGPAAGRVAVAAHLVSGAPVRCRRKDHGAPENRARAPQRDPGTGELYASRPVGGTHRDRARRDQPDHAAGRPRAGGLSQSLHQILRRRIRREPTELKR